MFNCIFRGDLGTYDIQSITAQNKTDTELCMKFELVDGRVIDRAYIQLVAIDGQADIDTIDFPHDNHDDFTKCFNISGISKLDVCTSGTCEASSIIKEFKLRDYALGFSGGRARQLEFYICHIVGPTYTRCSSAIVIGVLLLHVCIRALIF